MSRRRGQSATDKNSGICIDFYFEYETIIYVVALALPVVLCAAHYLAIGPKQSA